MYNDVHIIYHPFLYQIIEFLDIKQLFQLNKLSKKTSIINYKIKNCISDKINEIFKYYEKYFDIPFLTKKRTGIHIMKIDFIYQNFYIFTNKKYVINLKLYKNPIKCYYKIDHQNIKKIFKYYCSLTNVYYSDDLLYNALKYNKFKIMDLVY